MQSHLIRIFTSLLRPLRAKAPLGLLLIGVLCCPTFGQGARAPAVQPVNPQPPGPDIEELELAAIQAAASSGDVNALRSYLGNADIAVQTAAFDALAAQDTAQAVKDLLDVVNDTSAPGRVQALQMLDATPLADDQTVMNNLRGATGGPDTAMSTYAADALARREHPDEGQVLNSSPGEQFSAEKSTPSEPAPTADTAAPGEDKQLDSASSSHNPGVSEGDAAKDAGQENKVPIDEMAARFRDRSLPAAERLQALQKIDASNGDEWQVTAVLREAMSDTEPTLRAFAVQALAKRATTGSVPATDAVREAVHSNDRAVRLLAVQSLGRTDGTLPLLQDAASDLDKEVRAAAESLLNSTGRDSSASTPAQQQ